MWTLDFFLYFFFCLKIFVVSFDQEVKLWLKEGQQVNFNLKEEVARSFNFTFKEGEEVVFNFFNNDYDDYFYIRNDELMMKRGIDCEILSKRLIQVVSKIEKEEDCKVLLEIVSIIKNSGFLKIIKLEFQVEDVNNKGFEFLTQNKTLFFSVPESSPLNSTFFLVSLKDLDFKFSNNFRVDFVNQNKYFNLVYTEVNRNTINLYLLQKFLLDREVDDKIETKILITDLENLNFFSQANLTITIEDVNDNRPIFELLSYPFNVSFGNSSHSVPLGVIRASDRDSGHNSKIDYKFIDSSQESDFKIDWLIFDKSSNFLFFKNIDKCSLKSNSYKLKVVAFDFGSPSLESEVDVVLNFKKKNCFPPNIKISHLSHKDRVEVMEHSSIGTIVTLLQVEDQDRDQVVCFLDHSSFNLMKKHDSLYLIIISKVIDREKTPFMQVFVKCADDGQPNLTSSLEIKIEILDINDHTPKFEKDFYLFEVEENNLPNHFLGRVIANDKDIEQNAELVYSLEKHSKDLLVDRRTGSLVLKNSVDYETTEEIVFWVKVRDKGEPFQESKTKVVLKILNLNDCKPIFFKKTYKFAILENQPIRSLLGTVTAVDPDKPPFEKFYYQVRKESNKIFEQYFHLNHSDGVLRTIKQLDRETKKAFNFEILAIDSNNNFLVSTCNVEILIIDKNDNYPIIIFPSPTNISFNLSVHSLIGVGITKIEAKDYDYDANSALSYHFTNNSDDEILEFIHLDPQTGEVTLKKSLYTATLSHFKIYFAVSDSGDPPLTSQGSFILNIIREEADEDLPKVAHLHSLKFFTKTNNYNSIPLLTFIALLLVFSFLILFLLLTKLRRNKIKINSIKAKKINSVQDSLIKEKKRKKEKRKNFEAWDV